MVCPGTCSLFLNGLGLDSAGHGTSIQQAADVTSQRTNCEPPLLPVLPDKQSRFVRISPSRSPSFLLQPSFFCSSATATHTATIIFQAVSLLVVTLIFRCKCFWPRHPALGLSELWSVGEPQPIWKMSRVKVLLFASHRFSYSFKVPRCRCFSWFHFWIWKTFPIQRFNVKIIIVLTESPFLIALYQGECAQFKFQCTAVQWSLYWFATCRSRWTLLQDFVCFMFSGILKFVYELKSNLNNTDLVITEDAPPFYMTSVAVHREINLCKSITTFSHWGPRGCWG